MTPQDKTLADYIKRTQEQTSVWVNRNVWNDPALAEQDRENPNDYKVYPEYPIDSDYKRNPFSTV